MYTFINGRENYTKCLFKIIKGDNSRAIYVTGSDDDEKATFVQSLKWELKSSFKTQTIIFDKQFDLSNYIYRKEVDDPNMKAIFESLLLNCFDRNSRKNLGFKEILNTKELKDAYIILTVEHLDEILLQKPNYLDLFKKHINEILKALPKCYIICTTTMKLEYLDKKQNGICLERFLKRGSLQLLQTFFNNNEKLKKYEERLTKLSFYLPLNLSFKGKIWQYINLEFCKNIQKFNEYLQNKSLIKVICSCKTLSNNKKAFGMIEEVFKNVDKHLIAYLLIISYIPGSFSPDAMQEILDKRLKKVENLKEMNILTHERSKRFNFTKSIINFMDNFLIYNFPEENRLIIQLGHVKLFGRVLENLQNIMISKDKDKICLLFMIDYEKMQKYLIEAINGNNEYKPYINATIRASYIIALFLQKDSLKLYEDMLKASRQMGTIIQQATLLNIIAFIYWNYYKDNDKSLEYAFESLATLDKCNEDKTTIENIDTLSNLYNPYFIIKKRRKLVNK